MGAQPRALIVHRATELEELLVRHGTRGAVEFFLRTRGRTLARVQSRHDAIKKTIREVDGAIPSEWRRGRIERSDLPRFLFEPGDTIVVVGQDGLVANVAKYLDGQPVIGVNPEPAINPGVLVPLRSEDVQAALAAVSAGDAPVESRTMVEVTTDDGQHLLALNEIYIGEHRHQSSRYRLLLADGREERQSSSGAIVGTGTGATGWCRSIHLQSRSALALPRPEDAELAWFVREPWPSPATGTSLTEGLLAEGETLRIIGESDGLVAFGDGMERDRLSITWGQGVELGMAKKRLKLVATGGSQGTTRRTLVA